MADQPILKRLPSPYLVFLATYIVFYFSPVIYVANGLTDTVTCEAGNYLKIASIFLMSYLLGGVLLYNSRFIIPFSVDAKMPSSIPANLSRLVKIFVIAGAAYVIFYAFFSGLNKLAMLGSDLDKETFRFIGYDDESIVLQLPLELARRILLPLAAVYSASAFFFYRKKEDMGIFLLSIAALFLGAIVTLDRSPVLLAVVTLMFCFYVFSGNFRFVFVYFPLFIVLIPMTGSLITMWQHNLTEFGFMEIWEQAFAVAKNRIWLDPLRMACKASFDLFNGWDNCLFLKYSRVTSFITGQYVGTYSDNSIYVTPVGIVGDVWRNFGYLGIVILPTFLGALLIAMGKRMERCHPVVANVVLFVAIEFAFYVNYGNLFSYGAILLLFFIGFMTMRAFRGGVKKEDSRGSCKGS